MGGYVDGLSSPVERDPEFDESAQLLTVREGEWIDNGFVRMFAVPLVLGDSEGERPDVVHDRDVSVHSSRTSARKLAYDLAEEAGVEGIEQAATRAVGSDIDQDVTRVVPALERALDWSSGLKAVADDVCKIALA